MKFCLHIQLNGDILFAVFRLPPRFSSRPGVKLVNNVLYSMVKMRVIGRVSCRFAPKALLSVFQVGHDAVSFGAVEATGRGGEESGLATDEEVAGGGVAGAEFTGPVEQARVEALAVALPAIHCAAAGDQRHDKQSAQSHSAVGLTRAAYCTTAEALRPTRPLSRHTAPAPVLPCPAVLLIQRLTRELYLSL